MPALFPVIGHSQAPRPSPWFSESPLLVHARFVLHPRPWWLWQKLRTESVPWLSEFLRIQDKSEPLVHSSNRSRIWNTPMNFRGQFLIKVKIREELMMRNRLLRRKLLLLYQPVKSPFLPRMAWILNRKNRLP